jgi:uncharacterized protein with beta-barrel porin domain
MPTLAAALLVAGTYAGLAQAPGLGVASSFAVLAGSTVTNTGPSVITGDIGVFPGTAVVGFPPGTVLPPFTTHAGNAVAAGAQADLTTAFSAIAATPATSDLSGQNLGNRTLTPGVYNFSASAQLTGNLTLNAQGDPNAVFIFKIGSTLTTASGSNITLAGGAEGRNVFFQVGSSATLGTTTSFVGSILADQSITATTGASILCGRALARIAAVTLDTNNIIIPTQAKCIGPLIELPGVVLPPTVVIPPGVVVVPPGVVPPDVIVPSGVLAVTNTINAAYLSTGGVVPPAFLALAGLARAEQIEALQQLSGEAATGMQPAVDRSMNSFLRQVLNPFAGGPFAGDRFAAPPAPPNVVRALGYAPDSPRLAGAFPFEQLRTPDAATDRRHWGIWAAASADHSWTGGRASAGSHDRSVITGNFSAGLDHRIAPNTVVGFSLGGGGTGYDLTRGLGGGRSEMFQAAAYAFHRLDGAYIAGAAAYAGHFASTDRQLTFTTAERLTSRFFASNVGGRIEAGYRFAFPDRLVGWSTAGSSQASSGAATWGLTPYAAAQVQAYMRPGYTERSVLGPSAFALTYDSMTAVSARTELGAWFDRTIAFDNTDLVLRARIGWAHDHFDDPTTVTASFASLPGSRISVTGAIPTRDSALVSVHAWLKFTNGISVGAKFDGEFAGRSESYAGTGVLRYTW